MRRSGSFVGALLVLVSVAVVAQDGTEVRDRAAGYDAGEALVEQARRAVSRGDWRAALPLWARAAEAFDAVPAVGDALRVRREVVDVVMASQQRDYYDAEVERAIDRLLETAQGLGDDPLQARALLARSWLREAAGAGDAALSDVRAAIQHASRAGSGILLGMASLRLDGIVHTVGHTGDQTPTVEASQRQAISLLASGGSVGSDTALSLLSSLAHARGAAGDRTYASTAATAAAIWVLDRGDRWHVTGVLDSMGGLLRQINNGQTPVGFLAAIRPKVDTLTDPVVRAVALGSLARIAIGDKGVCDDLEAAMMEAADGLTPLDRANLHLIRAESLTAAGDRMAAVRCRALAKEALLSIEDPLARVQLAVDAANRAVGQADGRWALDLIHETGASLPESAQEARALASIHLARVRLQVAAMEYNQARAAAANAGEDPGAIESPLDAARQAAMEDLEWVHSIARDDRGLQLSPGLLVSLAEVERQLGDYLAAEVVLNRAIAAARSNADPQTLVTALWQQALTQHELGRDERAGALAAEALSVPGASIGSWLMPQAAGMLANAGRYGEAVAAYERLLRQDPSEWAVREAGLGRAWARLMAGEDEQARADFASIPMDEQRPARIASAVLGRSVPSPIAGAEPTTPWFIDSLLYGPMNTVGEAKRIAALARAALGGLQTMGTVETGMAGWRLCLAEACNLSSEFAEAHAMVEGVAAIWAAEGMTELQVRALVAEATACNGMGRTAEAERLWGQVEELTGAGRR